MALQMTPPPVRIPLEARQMPFRLLNGAVHFNGNCEECRPFCGAVCCRSYAFVPLSDEEVQSGLYAYKEVTDDCQCDSCQRMRDKGIRYTLRRLPDGSCVYLDGTRQCSIYDHRPETCRRYTCVGVPFVLTP